MRGFLRHLWARVSAYRECDFVPAIARPYPSLTIATVLGAPHQDAGRLHEWSSWVRRQFAPSRYPPGHAPHAWHQDGALGFDFLQPPTPLGSGGLLAMLTCWVALTPCGRDAPGLELVVEDPQTLLPLAALDDAAIRSGHGVEDFWRPLMCPGDCLTFGGGVLHHTHVSPEMRLDRTSIEMRFFDANRIDPRLHRDRFVAIH